MSLKEHEYIPPDAGTLHQLPLDEFCDHILITELQTLPHALQEKTPGPVFRGELPDRQSAKDINCTLIDFGIGSPQAALVITAWPTSTT